jgi:sugar O-acyltransferase (sialic acid O-acetyltransferase NeuD family)
MIKELIIVGASGMGREVFDLCHLMPQCGKEWKLRGFLDTRAELLNGLGDYPPILGSPFRHKVEPDQLFLCAVADPFYRGQISELIRSRGGRFLSLVHPGAEVSRFARLGEGCVVYGGAGVGPNVTLGDFVFLNAYASVGHDTFIGTASTIGPQNCVGGWTRIGHGVFTGSNATILPRVVLEDYCYVGAGSVVLRRVKARTKVFGNPAVPIGQVELPENWLAEQMQQQEEHGQKG